MATDYSKLTVQQLKTELAEKGLEQTGKKAELVARLESYILDGGEGEEDMVDEAENGVLEEENEVDEAEVAEEEAEEVQEDAEEEAEAAGEDEAEEEAEEEEAGDPTEEAMEEETEQDEQLETSAKVNDSGDPQDETEEPEDDAEEVVEIKDDTEGDDEDAEVDNEEKDEQKKDSITAKKGAKDDADEAAKSKDGVATKSPGKKDRWVKVLFGKRGKFNHLDCIQLFTQKRKMKDMQVTRAAHRVRIFPLLLEDINNPVVESIIRKCSAINMNMHNMMEKDTVVQKVMMVLVFNKESEIEKSIAELKEFKPDLMVSTSGYDKFQDKTMVLRTQGGINMEETTLLIPRLPERITEDDLWQMFPTAWEIFLIKCHKDQKEKVVPKGKSDTRQPSYAYVYFPNLEVSRKATRDLGATPAPDDIPNLTLIPLSSLSAPEKYVGKAAKSNTTTTGKQSSIFSADPIEPTSDNRRQVTPGKQAGAGAKPRANKQAGNAKASPMTAKGRTPLNKNQPRPNRQANQSFSPRGMGRDTQRRGSNVPSGARIQGRGGMGVGYGNQSFNQGGFRNQQMHQQQQQQQMNMFNQQSRMASEKEQGLQVLGNLLSSIGGQQAQGNPANALLQMLGGQQQMGQQSHGGQQQQFGRGQQQQFNRGPRSPKRARSPNDRDSAMSKRRRQEMGGRKDMMNKDRRYSGGAARRDPYQTRPEREYSAATREVTAATYAPMPGYEQEQSTSMSSRSGYGGTGNRQAHQGSGGDMYESLDVVSRIVRASKELKDAMHKGDGGSQSYDSYNTSQSYGSNQQQSQGGYGESGNYNYTSGSYNRY